MSHHWIATGHQAPARWGYRRVRHHHAEPYRLPEPLPLHPRPARRQMAVPAESNERWTSNAATWCLAALAVAGVVFVGVLRMMGA